MPHLQTDTQGHFAVKSFSFIYPVKQSPLSREALSLRLHTWHPWLLYSFRKSLSWVQAARWRVLLHRRSEGISSIQLLESSKYWGLQVTQQGQDRHSRHLPLERKS